MSCQIADIRYCILKCIRSVIGRAGLVFLMIIKVDGLQTIDCIDASLLCEEDGCVF